MKLLRLSNYNISDVFVGLWCLYYLQGIIYPHGIINQIVQLLMILLGGISFCKCLFESYKPMLIKATIALVIMYVVYGLIIIIFGDDISWTPDSNYLKNSLNSLLPIFFFYRQVRQGKLTIRRINIYTFLMLAVVFVYFNYFSQQLEIERESEENTNNIGYMFVGLLPLVFLYRKRLILQYILLAFIMFYILMGMKRGAILIGGISVLLYLHSGLKKGSTKKKFFTIVLSSIIVLGTIYYINYLMLHDVFFMSRLERTLDGDSSGRDYIYKRVWDAVSNETNGLKILFGHGANSTIKFAGNFAHQDWLETACNNGVLGVCILLNFFIAFAITVFKSKKNLEPYYYYCFLTILFISFSKTLFSMSIQNFDVYQSMLIGYFVYWTSKEGRNKAFLHNGNIA